MAREQVKRKAAAKAVELGAGALIRDGALAADDPWILLADDEAADEGADIVVSMPRFKAEREALLARHAGRLGVLIDAGEAIEEVADDAPRLTLVMVRFPAFRDGRGFTTARLLRERYKYSGELRAVGDVLEDQIFFMLRCGFDAFELIAADPAAAFARASRLFSAAYQPAADRRVPAARLRSKKKSNP
jgi:uncharacterized protein (DUF934 family)